MINDQLTELWPGWETVRVIGRGSFGAVYEIHHDSFGYDTLSSFSNQDSGGVIMFGIDENAGFEVVGVYDPQDLQKVLSFGSVMRIFL